MPVKQENVEYAVLIQHNKLGEEFSKVFLCLAGIGDTKLEGIEEKHIKQVQQLGLGRRDYDVLSKKEVLILTSKGKRVAAILREMRKK